MITNDARCTREIKYRIVMTKAAFSRKKTVLNRKLELNLRKKLVKCYIWSMAARKVRQKHLKNFEMWYWRRIEKISWTDRLRKETVLE
jgi:hypothetical protein